MQIFFEQLLNTALSHAERVVNEHHEKESAFRTGFTDQQVVKTREDFLSRWYKSGWKDYTETILQTSDTQEAMVKSIYTYRLPWHLPKEQPPGQRPKARKLLKWSHSPKNWFTKVNTLLLSILNWILVMIYSKSSESVNNLDTALSSLKDTGIEMTTAILEDDYLWKLDLCTIFIALFKSWWFRKNWQERLGSQQTWLCLFSS